MGKTGKSSKITFRSVSVQYGDKDFFIADTFSDSLSFHSDILRREKHMLWGRRIEDEVKKCDDLARLIEELSRKLNLSVGSEQSGEAAKAEFYRQIDLPFRRWLGELDPQNEQDCGYEYAEKKM